MTVITDEDYVVINIDNVVADGKTATVVRNFSDRLAIKEELKTMVNLDRPVGHKETGKWRVLTFEFDSYVNIFDSYINQGGDQPAFAGTFKVEQRIVYADKTEKVMRYTYTSANSRMLEVPPTDIEYNARRNPIEYKVITYGTRTVTFT